MSYIFCTFIVDYQLLSINYAEAKIQHSPRLPYTSRGILQVDTQIIVRKNGTNEIYR